MLATLQLMKAVMVAAIHSHSGAQPPGAITLSMHTSRTNATYGLTGVAPHNYQPIGYLLKRVGAVWMPVGSWVDEGITCDIAPPAIVMEWSLGYARQFCRQAGGVHERRVVSSASFGAIASEQATRQPVTIPLRDDNSLVLQDLVWSDWGRSVAQAEGTLVENTATAQRSATVHVLLGEREDFPSQRPGYHLLAWTYTAAPLPGYPQAFHIVVPATDPGSAALIVPPRR